MSKIEQIERDVQSLAPNELAAFRKWFQDFDAAAWDRQIKDDVHAGKVDGLADAALKASEAGKCSEL